MTKSDVLLNLSLARTALDDPGSLDEEQYKAAWDLRETPAIEHGEPRPVTERRTGHLAIYALHQIDAAMHGLDVELHPKLALETTGKLIAEIADSFEDGPAAELGQILHDALDRIDSVIERLGTGPEDE
jgi:hypothetical protein